MITSNDNAELTERDLRDYFAAFNSNDFEGFSRYYADNLIFEGRGRHFRSRDEMVGFYRKLKSRIRETVTLKEVLVGESEMVVEIETELDAFEDWLDMPMGAIRKGDRHRTQGFVWYQIENNKFAHLRSATYRRVEDHEPSSVGKPFDPSSQSLPPSMSKERFAAYIDAFNKADYAALGDYYNDDAVLVISGKIEFHGRQAIVDFHKANKANAQQTIQINRVITAGDLLAAELQSEFAAAGDAADFFAGPMNKGERISIINFIFHDLRDGRFSRIRSAEFRTIVQP